MNAGQTVFSQLMDHLPTYESQKCVERYRGDAHLRGFSWPDQYLAMAFAQLTYRESLRDIEACLGSMHSKLYHMGFRGRVTRSTLDLRSGRHRPQTARAGGQPLPIPTDSQPNSFRENAYFTGTSG